MPRFQLFLSICMLAAGLGSGLSAQIAPDQIDLASCRLIFKNGETAAPPELVKAALGVAATSAGDTWSSLMRSKYRATRGTDFSLVIALKQAQTFHSLICSEDRVRYLKSAAAYPGDRSKPAQWQELKAPPHQGTPYVIPLAQPAKSRVFVIVGRVNWRGGTPPPALRFSAKRLFNASPVAIFNAESEYTLKPDMGPPRTYAAADLARGGTWINVGPDKKTNNRILRPPISKFHPAWLVLSWAEARTVSGLVLRSNIRDVKLYAFRGKAGVNPAIADKSDWKLLRPKRVPPAKRLPEARQFSFPPVKTRGIRLVILETTDKAVCKVNGLTTITELGDGPIPDATAAADLPPYRISYNLAERRIVTMVVNDLQGRRVRNVMARRDRPAGAVSEPWNLKDEAGQYIKPGKYRFTALSHPGLELRYQMTPYPNVDMYAPQNAPWSTGHNGTGGWLADHSYCQALCTAGDRIYVGSPCAEDGLAMFEANLLGQKLWSRHNFIAWTGPQRMTSNGKEVFVHAGKGARDHIWAVDIKTKNTRTVWEPKSTSTRKRGIKGMVATGDTLFLAVRGEYRWLVNAFGAADVDIRNCYPKYKAKTKRDDRYAPDSQVDFKRLFRLTGTPPGQRQGLTYITSTRGPRAQQHAVLACKRPVPIGSLVFPMFKSREISLRLSVLKPDAKYPPDPERNEDWQKLDLDEAGGWSVVAAPPKTSTRALRITFVKGEDDELADIMLDEDAAGDAWEGRLEGMTILRRRYKNLFYTAKVRVNSGTVSKGGVWDAERKLPLSPENPGIYVLEWAAKQKLRGLAVKEIDGREMQVDVFTGPAGARVDLEDDKHWEQVGSYIQARRYYYHPDPNCNANARYMDGYVDFGDEYETRAIRLRVVSQYVVRKDGRAGQYGVREDRGGKELDPTRCRIYGVAPLQYLGGDTPVDPRIAERIEEFDVAAGKVTCEVHVPQPGYMNINAKGELFVISAGRLCRLEWPSGKVTPFPCDAKRPGAFDFDKQDNLYVFDWFKDRQNIRVYSPAGKLLRTIGTPGGFKMGLWDPSRLGRILAIAIDQKDQLWTVGGQFYPQRLTRWSLDGKVLSEHFGRTRYGGGGVLDPGDKSLLYYGPLEFKLDWDTGKTKLQALTWIGKAEAGEQPIYVNGRKYMVNRGPFFRISCGVVHLYENHKTKLVAAVGLADKFPPLNTPEIKQHLGKRSLTRLQFTWSDLNGDQQVQVKEVQFAPRTVSSCQVFDDELGIMAGNTRFQVKEFLPNGVPVYETVKLPVKDGNWLRMANGNYFHMGGRHSGDIEGWTPDGRKLWSYPSEGNGVHAYYRAKPLHPEQVVSNFTIMGRGKAPAGDLGEFYVMNTNCGIWHLWTADGILAGKIMLDLRHPKARRWNFPEHERNMKVPPVTAGQEHFWGHVTTSPDNRCYGVYRSTHVFEILGLDKFKRTTGVITVTEQDIRQAVKWEKERQRRKVYRDAKIYTCRPIPNRIHLDGDAGDWAKVAAVSLHGDRRDFNAWFRAGYINDTLYVCFETAGMGAFKNSGEDFKRMFKSGGCVDLKIAANPTADATRKGPVQGDLRLLIAPIKGKPTAILYEAEKPGAPENVQTTYATMVFKTEFDSVRVLPEVKIAQFPAEHGYVVEAAIPIKELGLTISDDKTVKMDWGVIRTDQTGNGILGRYYWSNKATTIISDVAAEAHLEPRLWGHIRFKGKKKSALDRSMNSGLLGVDGDTDADTDDLLEELESD